MSTISFYMIEGEKYKKSKVFSLSIFDFHAHLPGPLPQYSWGWESWFVRRYGTEKLSFHKEQRKQEYLHFLKQRGFPSPDESQPAPDEAAGLYARAVENYGLSGICFLTGGGNETLARAIEPYSKLYGFAHHDPFQEGSASELEHAITHLKLRGYKLLATALRRPLTSRKLANLWEICELYEIPVVIHFGPLGGGGIAYGPNVNPCVLHDIAKAYPKVPFVVPHFGVGYVRELLQLMWACENVYVDTSGSNRWRYYSWPQPTLCDLFKLFYEQFGGTRIIFGTDSSFFPRGWVAIYAVEQLEAAEKAGIPCSAIEDIFRNNALRLLKLQT